MAFYLIVYILVILIYKHSPKHACIYILLITFLLAVFRDSSVGSDYKVYCTLIESGYYNIDLTQVLKCYISGDFADKNPGTGSLREFGFSFTVSFLSSFLDSHATVSCIILLILLIYLYATYRVLRDWANVSLAIFILFSIFILYSPYNTLRQSLSVAIIVLAGTYIADRRWFTGFFLILLSSTIHFTSILAGIVVVISQIIQLKPRICLYTLFCAALIYLLQFNIDFIIKIFPDDYAGRDLLGLFNERIKIFNIYAHYIRFGFIIASILLFKLFLSKSNSNCNLFYTLWFVGIFLYSLLMQSPNIGRISEYFYAFMPFACILTLENRRFDKETTYQYLIAYCIFWHFIYILFNWYGIQPYIIKI